ncbi:MAG: hypothetical protein HC822_12680 [Oscillochloris sp.]|nr:hypothetical protein [Oscillochloris sp.]
MSSDQNDVEQSIRRVRRGCLGVGALVGAMAIMLTLSTGNLFYLTLLVLTLGLILLSRAVR